MTFDELAAARAVLQARRLELMAALETLTDPPTLEEMARAQRLMVVVNDQTRLVRQLMGRAA